MVWSFSSFTPRQTQCTGGMFELGFVPFDDFGFDQEFDDPVDLRGANAIHPGHLVNVQIVGDLLGAGVNRVQDESRYNGNIDPTLAGIVQTKADPLCLLVVQKGRYLLGHAIHGSMVSIFCDAEVPVLFHLLEHLVNEALFPQANVLVHVLIDKLGQRNAGRMTHAFAGVMLVIIVNVVEQYGLDDAVPATKPGHCGVVIDNLQTHRLFKSKSQ
jgi:hypothetical protein